jgi:hypothetical protein
VNDLIQDPRRTPNDDPRPAPVQSSWTPGVVALIMAIVVCALALGACLGRISVNQATEIYPCAPAAPVPEEDAPQLVHPTRELFSWN